MTVRSKAKLAQQITDLIDSAGTPRVSAADLRSVLGDIMDTFIDADSKNEKAIGELLTKQIRAYLLEISLDQSAIIITGDDDDLPIQFDYTVDNAQIFGTGEVDVWLEVEIAGVRGRRERWIATSPGLSSTTVLSESVKTAIKNKIEVDPYFTVIFTFYAQAVGGIPFATRTFSIDLLHPSAQKGLTDAEKVRLLGIALEPSSTVAVLEDFTENLVFHIDNPGIFGDSPSIWYQIRVGVREIGGRTKWNSSAGFLTALLDQTEIQLILSASRARDYTPVYLDFYTQPATVPRFARRTFDLDLIRLNAADVTVDASGFDGNLAKTDNTLQKVAQKVDDLQTGAGSGQDEQISLLGLTLEPSIVEQSNAGLKRRFDIRIDDTSLLKGDAWYSIQVQGQPVGGAGRTKWSNAVAPNFTMTDSAIETLIQNVDADRQLLVQMIFHDAESAGNEIARRNLHINFANQALPPQVVLALDWTRAVNTGHVLPANYRDFRAVAVIVGKGKTDNDNGAHYIPIGALATSGAGVQLDIGTPGANRVEWTPSTRMMSPANSSARIAYMELV